MLESVFSRVTEDRYVRLQQVFSDLWTASSVAVLSFTTPEFTVDLAEPPAVCLETLTAPRHTGYSILQPSVIHHGTWRVKAVASMGLWGIALPLPPLARFEAASLIEHLTGSNFVVPNASLIHRWQYTPR